MFNREIVYRNKNKHEVNVLYNYFKYISNEIPKIINQLNRKEMRQLSNNVSAHCTY